MLRIFNERTWQNIFLHKEWRVLFTVFLGTPFIYPFTGAADPLWNQYSASYDLLISRTFFIDSLIIRFYLFLYQNIKNDKVCSEEKGKILRCRVVGRITYQYACSGKFRMCRFNTITLIREHTYIKYSLLKMFYEFFESDRLLRYLVLNYYLCTMKCC